MPNNSRGKRTRETEPSDEELALQSSLFGFAVNRVNKDTSSTRKQSTIDESDETDGNIITNKKNKKGKGAADTKSNGKKDGKKGRRSQDVEDESDSDDDSEDMNIDFSIDRTGTTASTLPTESSSSSSSTTKKKATAGANAAATTTATAAVWSDKDDETLQVELSATDRLKKFIPAPDATGGGKPKSKVSGKELSNLLQER